jgi:hypothetical protein
MLNATLHAKWIWLQKTDGDRPWSRMTFAVKSHAAAIFHASVSITVGDGSTLLFWEDPWIDGLGATTIAPAIVKMVKPRFKKQRSVQAGMQGHAWTADIAGELSVDAVVQFMKLWAAVEAVNVGEGADVFRWKWTASGAFSSRSAYRIRHEGTVALLGATNIWHAYAPMEFKMHAWLALRRRCWTADRLVRRGLPAPASCKLCNMDGETLDHLSLHCPYARQFWSATDAGPDFDLALPLMDQGIGEWWTGAVVPLPVNKHKEANSLIMLVLRSLWLERNARIFDRKEWPARAVAMPALDIWRSWISGRGRTNGGLLRDIT